MFKCRENVRGFFALLWSWRVHGILAYMPPYKAQCELTAGETSTWSLRTRLGNCIEISRVSKEKSPTARFVKTIRGTRFQIVKNFFNLEKLDGCCWRTVSDPAFFQTCQRCTSFGGKPEFFFFNYFCRKIIILWKY